MESISNQLVDEFRARLQGVYETMLQSCGIESGDISPDMLVALDAAEKVIADVVADWVVGFVDLGVLAAVPADRQGPDAVRAVMIAQQFADDIWHGIEEDMSLGVVPRTVRSYAELLEVIDAHGYLSDREVPAWLYPVVKVAVSNILATEADRWVGKA